MIFFDNASTTNIDAAVLDTFIRTSKERGYNPSALYSLGVDAHKIIDESKQSLLRCLGGMSTDNIIFTSGATESNNQALFGCITKNSKVLVSEGEHPSVYNTSKELSSRGYNVSYVKLTRSGQVDIDDFTRKMTPDTSFVSVIHVSNETGAVNDIKQLLAIAKKINPKVIFHSDGVQAFGKIPFKVCDIDVDLFSISAHKIGGPKGVGALYVKKGVAVKPILFGGGQERGLRSGTENVAGIAAFVTAAEMKCKNVDKNYKKVTEIKRQLIELCREKFPTFTVNGSSDSPYILSCSFGTIKGETLLHFLESKQIYVSNGSACSSKNADNRVLSAMGVDTRTRDSSIRVSFSDKNSVEEVNMFVHEVGKIVKK